MKKGERITIRLSEEKVKELQEKAEKINSTKSGVIRILINEYLKNL